jgi:ubiquinol-cytochrome c reductase cytochrome b subunit
MYLGAKHVETPFIELGQGATILYFLYFFVIVFSVSLIETTFKELSYNNK